MAIKFIGAWLFPHAHVELVVCNVSLAYKFSTWDDQYLPTIVYFSRQGIDLIGSVHACC